MSTNPSKPCDLCGKPAYRSNRCESFICERCAGNHVGKSSCWCGWVLSEKEPPLDKVLRVLERLPSGTKH